MEIQPIVIGTAGHIDHGKSTLVRALTGVDPDRLKEEQARGLTIDLGFAPLTLPDGRTVGIVDVPGHERFVRNMVAGATGIDLVVLVVAADDGVMPQTREHIEIMQLLGVSQGLVALTKIDAVDAELVELAADDVRGFLAGTFLEDAPVLPVSPVTGEGMEALREALFARAAACSPRAAEGLFRMPIQRVFSLRGRGTVVTGIPVSGTTRVGDVLEVVSGSGGGGRGKVRGLQAYREETESARAGHSTAVNLSDVDHRSARRGDVLAVPGYFAPVEMIGARLEALASLERPITNRLAVRLHTGTSDPAGEVVLLDREEIGPGESGIVQVRLTEPVVCAPGDRFVLRLVSPVVTLGGGVILEESRFRLKRFKAFVIEELDRQERSLASRADLLESVLARRGAELVGVDQLARAIKRSESETAQLLEHLEGEGRVARPGRGSAWIAAAALEQATARVLAAVEAWFEEHPHRQVMDVRDLRRATGLEPAFLSSLLEVAEERGALALEAGGQVRLLGRAAELDPETERRAAAVLGRLAAAGLQPPSPAELEAELGAGVGAALELLADRGEVERVGPELVFATACLDAARRAVAENCERNGQLAIPELRDALGTTRKFLIPLLEHLDATGFTIRQGGHRVLKRR